MANRDSWDGERRWKAVRNRCCSVTSGGLCWQRDSLESA